jgi:hypothetical protein
MDLLEIHEFWEKFHKKETINLNDFDNLEDNHFETEDALVIKSCWILSDMISEAPFALQIFIYSNANFDMDDAVKLADKLNSRSKIAEYLHTIFDGKLETILNIIENLNAEIDKRVHNGI